MTESQIAELERKIQDWRTAKEDLRTLEAIQTSLAEKNEEREWSVGWSVSDQPDNHSSWVLSEPQFTALVSAGLEKTLSRARTRLEGIKITSN